MIRNCDNCKNQDHNKSMQDCNSFGYPLFADCENWIPKSEKVKKDLEDDELARKGKR